jgi:hypothetical protein
LGNFSPIGWIIHCSIFWSICKHFWLLFSTVKIQH